MHAPVAQTKQAVDMPPAEVVGHQLSLTPNGEIDIASSTTNLFDVCPQCQTVSFAYEEGCKKCYACGYSEC